jgi:aldose 1-epimerase
LDTEGTTLSVDHCFDGWNGLVVLRDEVLQTRVSSNLHFLVVYTLPERDNIAIEPVSHVNNAIGLVAAGGGSAKDLGVVELQPGETFSCEMRIETQLTPHTETTR